jgi:bifunctional non-homologous end joining protein LigD
MSKLLRHLPLPGYIHLRCLISMRKTNVARLLARQPEGIFVAPFEQGEIGRPFPGRMQSRTGRLVSKRRDRSYRAGRSPDWVKMKNRKHPAILRGEDFQW